MAMQGTYPCVLQTGKKNVCKDAQLGNRNSLKKTTHLVRRTWAEVRCGPARWVGGRRGRESVPHTRETAGGALAPFGLQTQLLGVFSKPAQRSLGSCEPRVPAREATWEFPPLYKGGGHPRFGSHEGNRNYRVGGCICFQTEQGAAVVVSAPDVLVQYVWSERSPDTGELRSRDVIIGTGSWSVSLSR